MDSLPRPHLGQRPGARDRSSPFWAALRAGVVGLLLAGCGNLTAGGLSETEVVVSGDAPDPTGVPTARQSWSDWVSQSEDDDFDGDVTSFEVAGAQPDRTLSVVLLEDRETGVEYRVRISEAATAFDAEGDLTDFAALVDALQADLRVRMQGNGTQDNEGVFDATLVKAEQDDDADEAEGQIEATFWLYLVDEAGTRIALNDDAVEVRIDIRGRQEADVLQRTVPSGAYRGMSIVFTELEVQVDSGLILDGREVDAGTVIDVELEADSLALYKPLGLRLDEGEVGQILVDLNTRAWLEAADPNLRQVARDIVTNAIDIRVR